MEFISEFMIVGSIIIIFLLIFRKTGEYNETPCIINLICVKERDLVQVIFIGSLLKVAMHIRRYIRAPMVLICHSIT